MACEKQCSDAILRADAELLRRQAAGEPPGRWATKAEDFLSEDPTMHMRKITKAQGLPLLVRYHYLKGRVADPMFVFGWYDARDTLRAVVFYAAPANRYFQKGAVELARLARDDELRQPLSSFVAESLRWLKTNTKLLYCLSYADTGEGHHGGIYQALSFDYVRASPGHGYWKHANTGERCSSRSFDQRAPEAKIGWKRAQGTLKYLYVRPLAEKRKHLLARFNWTPMPYPKPDVPMPHAARPHQPKVDANDEVFT
jgi:hypothetical protein